MNVGAKVSESEIKRIQDLLDKGQSVMKIAGTMRISKNTIYHYAKKKLILLNRTFNRPTGLSKNKPLFEDENFSEYDESVLFSHDRTYVF